MAKISIRAAKGRAFVVPGAFHQDGRAVTIHGAQVEPGVDGEGKARERLESYEVDDGHPAVIRALHDGDITKDTGTAARVAPIADKLAARDTEPKER